MATTNRATKEAQETAQALDFALDFAAAIDISALSLDISQVDFKPSKKKAKFHDSADYIEEQRRLSAEMRKQAYIANIRTELKRKRRRERQIQHTEFTQLEALVKATPSNYQRYQVFLSPELSYSDRLKLTAVHYSHVMGAILELGFEQLSNETFVSPKTGEVVVLNRHKSLYRVEPATAKSIIRLAYNKAKYHDKPFERREFSLEMPEGYLCARTWKRSVAIFGDDFYNPEYELDVAPAMWGVLDALMNAELYEEEQRIFPEHWDEPVWWEERLDEWEFRQKILALAKEHDRKKRLEEEKEYRRIERERQGRTSPRREAKNSQVKSQARSVLQDAFSAGVF